MSTKQDEFWKALRDLSLRNRLILAFVSALSTWPVGELTELIREQWPNLPIEPFCLVIGFIYGALVMVPFMVATRHRILRAAAMCVCSFLIFNFAIDFVLEGPLDNATLTPFFLVGGAAALLVGLSVALLGPHKIQWRLIGMTLVAGIFGGAAFKFLLVATDYGVLALLNYAAWQVPVCLALHFGLRPAAN